MSRAVSTKADLLGTWGLVSVQFIPSDASAAFDLFGPDPSGCLMLTPNGRLAALITARDRGPQVEEAEAGALMRTMMAYSGQFLIEGRALITSVDLAWHPSWLGT